MTVPWWLCPNEPRCPHAAVIHDVYDLEDGTPRCCAESCGCGKRTGDSAGAAQMTAAIADDGCGCDGRRGGWQ